MEPFVERKRWVFFGLPFTFTVYTVEKDFIRTKQGFLSTVEDSCYMYKVQDTKLTRSLGERIFGLATLKCYTGDSTDKVLELKHIKNAQEIKSFIEKTSDEERIRRRTINTLSIDASADLDGDGIPDNLES